MKLHKTQTPVDYWKCHMCADIGSTTFIICCPMCYHNRCAECTIYSVKPQVSSSFRKTFNSQPRNNRSDSPDYGERVQVEDKAYNVAADQVQVDPKPRIITKPPEDQGQLNISEGGTLINPTCDIEKPAVTGPTGPVSQSSCLVETTNATTPRDHHHSSGSFAVTKDIESSKAGKDLQFSEDGHATSSGYQIIEKEEHLENVESESDDISSLPLVALGARFGSCDKCGTLTSYDQLSCDKCNVTNQSDQQNPKIAPNISRSSSPDSIAESVFSVISDWSMSSLGAPDGANERFIALLLGDIVIKESCKKALTWLEPDKFERKLQRLLTQLASELRREAETKPQRQAARFVKYYARNSAYIICDSLKKDLNIQPSSSKGKSDSNSDTDDSDSGRSENELDDLNQLEAFIKNSKAFKDFMDKVEKFVCASINVTEAVDKIVDVPISNSDPAAVPEHDNDAMEQNGTKGIATYGEPAHNKPNWLSPLLVMIFWVAIPVGALMAWMAAVIKSRRPQLAEWKTRIEWTCTCGDQIWDDFTELQPGAAETYKNYLIENAARGNTLTRHKLQNKATNEPTPQESYLKRLNKSIASSNALTTIASHLGELRTSLSGCIEGLRRGLTRTSGEALEPGIPLHNQQPSLDLNIQNRVQPTDATAASQDPLFLILCYSEGRYATRLLQLNLISLKADCDYTLFHILRETYKSVCSRWSFLSLRKLAWIKFVNFEMYPSNLVDVRKIDDIPPPEHSQYTYDPVPPTIIPPVGDKHLMHLYHNPNCAAAQPLCLPRFPKKLRQPLLCENGGINPGWGLQFVEAWDIRKIWLLAFALFAVGSLLLGILWAVLKHSAQDAFAIAAYCISFATFSIGSLQALLVM